MKHAFVFAGQGSEEPGMGLPLAAVDTRARRLLEHASDATGLDVPRALERGARALERTDVLQPVLVAVGLGMAHALEAAIGAPSAVLGHSLGELSAALYACGVADERAIAIARARGVAMAGAAERSPGGMLATDGGPDVRARAEALGLSVAAENAPDELVLSGPREAIDALARALGARARRLRVQGPWHARSMADAAPALGAALAGALGPMRIPVISAVTGHACPDTAAVERALVDGLSSCVRFQAASAAARADTTMALAPSKVIASLLSRNGITARRLDRPEDLAR